MIIERLLIVQPLSFSRSIEHFFLTVGQNNFQNKIPLLVVLCPLPLLDKKKPKLSVKITTEIVTVYLDNDLRIYY